MQASELGRAPAAAVQRELHAADRDAYDNWLAGRDAEASEAEAWADACAAELARRQGLEPRRAAREQAA